jgi:hypothetical protein
VLDPHPPGVTIVLRAQHVIRAAVEVAQILGRLRAADADAEAA